MSPKNDNPLQESTQKIVESDLQEVAAVNDSLDELNNLLDCFEKRTDEIMEQLKELLNSNREIRKELALESARNALHDLDF